MTDLDRYGLFALAVVILLILFISMGNMDCDEDNEGYESVSLITELPVPEAVEVDDTISGLFPTNSGLSPTNSGLSPTNSPRGSAQAREDFDFDEDPASYPRSDADSPSGTGAKPQPKANTLRGAYILHKVREGESYSSISKKYYGSTLFWDCVQTANPGITPKSLKVGQMIRVPKKPNSSVAAAGGARRAGGAKNTTRTQAVQSIRHTVKKNDTLAGISKRYYGTTRKWRLIYDANRSKISNPDMLTVGASLSIPN